MRRRSRQRDDGKDRLLSSAATGRWPSGLFGDGSISGASEHLSLARRSGLDASLEATRTARLLQVSLRSACGWRDLETARKLHPGFFSRLLSDRRNLVGPCSTTSNEAGANAWKEARVGAMTLEGVFRLVAAGRIEAVGRYGWTCPLCPRELGFSEDPDSRDREAMQHCLAHSYRRMGRLPQIELNSVRRDKSRAFLPDGRAVSCQPGPARVA